MEIISALWIQYTLDEHSNICIQSWLNLNYTVNLYTYSSLKVFKNNNNICLNSKINVIDANIILKKTESDFLPLSDMFRFHLLNKSSKCLWIDTDMFLLKRLPKTNFVSSEHSNQTGAFKTKDRTKTPNIGIISQISGNLLNWTNIIKKCEKNNTKQNSNNNNFMKIYQKEMMTKPNLVAEPELYCPISWCYAKEIYTKKDVIGTKYGIDQHNIDWILDNSFSIHLWRNLFRTKKYEIKKDSIYSRLKDLVKQDYNICIPSYNRLIGIQQKTLEMLKQNNINKINIFVSTTKDYDEYKKADIGNIILVPSNYNGIGAVRDYIINKWAPNKSNIIMIDDDIEKIISKENTNVDLKTFFPQFFDKLEEMDLFFGGVPLCANRFFMKNEWSSNLKYISGAMQFVRVDYSREEISSHYRHFEDYFYNLAYHLRDGGILRWNGCSPITKNYNLVGGICDEMGSLEKRLDCEKIADEIIDKFGNKAVSKYWKKKSARGPACLNLRLNSHYNKKNNKK
tara:strand:+ start:304 stop:1836 length:1533 start_codon:yes stop_codon:yes gene_type:complete